MWNSKKPAHVGMKRKAVKWDSVSWKEVGFGKVDTEDRMNQPCIVLPLRLLFDSLNPFLFRPIPAFPLNAPSI
jgi:hypothetical protein